MTCKHGIRTTWTTNISKYTDDMIEQSVEELRESFGTGVNSGRHDLQVWRQIYEAEARKRGLRVE